MTKIKGTETTTRNVTVDIDRRDIISAVQYDINLSIDEAVRILKYRAKSKFELGRNWHDAYLDGDGKWYYDEECHGSHSWTSSHFIRAATPTEIEVYEAIDNIPATLVKCSLVSS